MYDFTVFGYYAAAVGWTFFPTSSEFASLMLSFATDVRPLVALMLGTYIDRRGRWAGLILTFAVMSIGTLSTAPAASGRLQDGCSAPIRARI